MAQKAWNKKAFPEENSNEEVQYQEHTNVPKQTYILKNLDCANCAAKIERKIQDLPQVDFASLIFTTKQLQVAANSDEDLLPVIQKIASSVEGEVVVVKIEKKTKHQAQKQTGRFSEYRQDFLEIGVGVLFLIAGSFTKSVNGYLSLALYLAGYIVLGREVLFTAVKNLTRGQVFDENFLMSIATLGALAIGEYPEAVGVMLFYRFGELFEDIAVSRSRSQIMDAVDMRPEVVNRVNGERTETIPAEDAMVGDLLLVRPGDRVPLDGIVMEGESRIDTSPVTGEPVPVAVKTGDSITSGCVNTSGLLKIRVQKVLEDSMVTRILNSVENAAAGKPKIDRFITRFSRAYTPFVVILAAATAIIPSLITGNWNYWVYTALTFLVISCPCALVLSVPLAFFSGIGAGSRRGILFKGGIAMEALEGVKTIVMDKTGTITQGNFAVQEVLPKAGMSKEELITLAGSCEMRSTHPIANSIVTAAEQENMQLKEPVSAEEISGKGIKAELEGKTVLCGNYSLMQEYQVDLKEYEDISYGTEVLVALNGVYVGRLVIADTIKKEAKSAVSELKRMGIATAMLTGDARESADNVAKETGINEVHAKLLPDDKVKELKKIRVSHGSVMFVGDGINDAPVLAGADVGAAMGSGADAAIEAADVVFMTSSVTAIPQSLKIARVTAAIAKQNVVFAIAVKILVMILGLAGLASMWMAVFADTGVAVLCILNSVRVLYKKIDIA
ncbi:heavy metal translocating P-type ATPase [Clostridium sp. C105KSO13]|uniref:heavy metal translocating P-type ATPase n=1 Tax=Clostridium sp. C105KSO13 TaxID=1776045 RepID=UPI0007406A41|nr:heavy metal translocating P-type ATPase [Clostridium sp. C105KSO13]CUX45155.1 Cadmium, zinc and cobalt-transporting ATPase [Clostridium sp. C105KSO13]